MKNLKTLLLAGALTLGTHSFSQYLGAPALVEMDAKRKSEAIDSVHNKKEKNVYTGSGALSGELNNNVNGRELSLYYRNDEHSLNENDSIDLKKYFELLPKDKIHYFQVRGYADINGDSDYNYKLGLKRAKRVSETIRKKYPNVSTEIISIGESGSEDNLTENRKVVAIPNEPSFYTDLQKSDADYFLLDLSGSMKKSLIGTGVPKYLFLREVKFPKDARIFGFFSGEIPKGEGLLDLNSFIPKGSSEIYGSSKDLIDKVLEENTDLHIFTDGVSTDRGYSCEDVIKAANKKGVEVSVIGLDMPKSAILDFMKIASETGGDYSVGESD